MRRSEPVTWTDQTIKDMICAVLDISPSTYSADIGLNKHPRWDSLAHVQVLLALEQAFGLVVSDDMYDRTRTVKDIRSYLEDHISHGI